MELNEKNFKSEVLESKIPVLVDFWAAWCIPCRMIQPIISEIEKEYNGLIKVAKLNVDENPNLAAEYQVMSIPTLAIFVNGELVDEIVGAVPKRTIVEKIKKYLPQN